MPYTSYVDFLLAIVKRAVPVADVADATGTGVLVATPSGASLGVAPLESDSVSAYGTATNPGAGAALATIAAGSLPAGTYKVCAQVVLSGVIAAGDLNNFEIREGASAVKRVIVAPAANSVGTAEVQITFDGATALSVNATGAASGASAVYSASVTATRVR